jgi:Zinc carboxypeptidase
MLRFSAFPAMAGGAVTCLVLGATVAAVAPAAAAPTNELKAAQAKARSCFTGPLPGSPGVDTRTVDSTVTGVVQARLTGSGDWDLAIYDGRTGAVVAGSAGYRTNELAEGFVTTGQNLIVQGCRYRGTADRATLSIEFFATPTPPPAARAGDQTVRVVDVATPRRADKKRLQGLGVDLTEHGDANSVEAVLNGATDVARLKKAGFRYTVRIADLAARGAANRAADRRYAAATKASALPSRRTSYRRLFDYQLEMKQLAARYPTLVRPLTLPNRTIEGRDVEGIEITKNAPQVADGKPVFLNMSLHHAREWPAAEHAMEFGYDLLRGYQAGGKVRALVSGTRTIILPVVNPDGFNVSREAPSIGGTFGQFDYEYKRKNCRESDSPAAFRGGTCGANLAGRLRGTDPNRNYGGFWGGVGASPVWSSDTFRGSAPFSEPEVANVRALVSSRQVTTLITNHTYSNLVLRPPGVFDVRPPLEDAAYEALGAKLTGRNGYTNQPSYSLYDTTGTTEDWSFWNTGGLGFTFEIGPDEFHPPYQTGVVAEYQGLAPAAGAGKGGNRRAYYDMLTATASTALHATIEGTAPAGAVLRVHKEFTTPTSPVVQADGSVGVPLTYTDVLDTTYRAPGGTFRFAVNPSTRPYVAGRLGRDPVAPPQPAAAFTNPADVPAENQGDPLAGAAERVPFTIKGRPEFDNATAAVSIAWGSSTTDWDLYVLNAAGEIVATSASGGTTSETARLNDPPAGDYTAVIVNFEKGVDSDWTTGGVAFANPLPSTFGPKETWTLTCERAGQVAASRSVFVDRGQVVDAGAVCRPGTRKR